MPSISNIRIGRKIGLALGATVALLAGLAALSLWALHSNERMANESIGRLATARLADMIAGESATISQYMGRMIVEKTTVDELVNQIVQMRKVRTSALAQLRARANNPKSVQQATELAELVKSADASNDTLMTWLAADLFDQATQEYKVSSELSSRMHAKAQEASAWQEQLVEEGEKARRKTSIMAWVALCVGCLTATGAAILAGLTLTRGISNPLATVVTNIEQIAGGDLTQDTPDDLRARQDEIGTLVRAMQTMKSGLRTTVEEISRDIGILSSSSHELMTTSTEMSAGSRHASERAHSVSTSVEQMSGAIAAVAATMELTDTNLSQVASSTREMTSTIDEIARNSESARSITDQASHQASEITAHMNRLGAAASEIGKVTDTINEISSQTNLLALNATIEAARAGAAGKGFAVVASEIKGLAQQTATATEDIKGRIQGIQSATSGGVAEIAKISQVIAKVNDIVTSIAAAIEQQSATAKDISRTIGDASQGVQEASARVSDSAEMSRQIALDIASVDRTAEETANGSGQVRNRAGEVSNVAEGLRTTIGRFRSVAER